MNRRLMILAVAGAVVLAGCARLMAQQPRSESPGTSSQLEAQRPEPPKTETQKPKAKPVPRTSQPKR